MLLAMVLSALVLIGWSFVSNKFFPTAGPQTQQIEDGKVRPVPQPQADPAADTPQAIREPRGWCWRKRRASELRLPACGGRSTSRARASMTWFWSLNGKPSTRIPRPSASSRPLGPGTAYFAQFGWAGQGVTAPDSDSGLDCQRAGADPWQTDYPQLDQPVRAAIRANRVGR